MKKLTLFLSIAFIGMTLYIGCEQESSKDDFSEITAGNDTVNFNSIPVGHSLEEAITISNPGKEDLTISSVLVEGTNRDDFIVTTSCNTVTAGNQCGITVKFQPSGYGIRTASIMIQSNARNNPEFSLPVYGIGLPQPGAWDGEDIHFYVSEDGKKITHAGSTLEDTAALIVYAEGSSCGSYITMTRYYYFELPILDAGFNYTSSNSDISGDFSGKNLCIVSGSMEDKLYYPYICSFTLYFSSLKATPQGSKSSVKKMVTDETVTEYYPDGRIKARIKITTGKQ